MGYERINMAFVGSLPQYAFQTYSRRKTIDHLVDRLEPSNKRSPIIYAGKNDSRDFAILRMFGEYSLKDQDHFVECLQRCNEQDLLLLPILYQDPEKRMTMATQGWHTDELDVRRIKDPSARKATWNPSAVEQRVVAYMRRNQDEIRRALSIEYDFLPLDLMFYRPADRHVDHGSNRYPEVTPDSQFEESVRIYAVAERTSERGQLRYTPYEQVRWQNSGPGMERLERLQNFNTDYPSVLLKKSEFSPSNELLSHGNAARFYIGPPTRKAADPHRMTAMLYAGEQAELFGEESTGQSGEES